MPLPRTLIVPADRGQSNVLGVVLLLGVTMLGVVAVFWSGTIALNTAQDTAQIGQVEQSMSQFDSKASLVGLGEARSQRATIPNNGDNVVADADAGWINVSLFNTTTDEHETTIVNTTLGALRYERAGVTVAYQGGGVWKQQDGRSVMISPPEFHYQGTTLTLPLLVITNSASLDRRVQISENGSMQRKYPNASADLRNPIGPETVRLTIKSRYYDAWAAFFRQRTDGRVSVDDANETVSFELLNPADQFNLTGGTMSAASGYQLELDNAAFLDSYDSADGSYASQPASAEGTIHIAAGLKLDNGATIQADVNSGDGEVTLDAGDTEIDGNLSYGGSLGDVEGTVTGWIANNGTAPDASPVDPLVESKKDTIAAEHDNSATPVITSEDEFNESHSSWELSAGKYFLNKMEIPSERSLVLNTTDGDITIVVDEESQIDGTITVQGSGRVNIYHEGDQLQVDGGNVSVPGDESPRFWVYGQSNFQASFDNGARFVGVIYAPGQEGQIQLDSGAEVFGALVGRVEQVDGSSAIHFDTALKNHQAVGDDAISLTFLHISVNPIEIT